MGAHAGDAERLVVLARRMGVDADERSALFNASPKLHGSTP